MVHKGKESFDLMIKMTHRSRANHYWKEKNCKMEKVRILLYLFFFRR